MADDRSTKKIYFVFLSNIAQYYYLYDEKYLSPEAPKGCFRDHDTDFHCLIRQTKDDC